MLILTRELDQSLIVGDDVVISIIEVRGRSIRIGVTAPEHVKVWRAELYEQATGKVVPKTSMGARERTGASRRRKRAKPTGGLDS